MRAIVMTEHGGPDVLAIQELPDPVPADGEVLIRVRAFGLNHADTYMRSGVWAFGISVLGIEAVGTVVAGSQRRALAGNDPSWRWSAASRASATEAMRSWSPCPPATWSRSIRV